MTISTELSRIDYAANGSTTVWSFSFPGGPNPDIHVFVVAADGTQTEVLTNLQINVNPAIAPNPTSVGGSVVYPVTGTPLAIGNNLIIQRDVPLIQPTSLANQAILYQEVVEKALDYVVMEVQQLQQQITDSATFNLPPCPERANKFLAFDADCNAIAVGNSNPITSTNGIRVPNTETVQELPQRSLRPGTIIGFDAGGEPILMALPPPNLQPLLGQRLTITNGPYIVSNAQKGFLLQAAGNVYYDINLDLPSNFDNDFSIAIFNADVYTGPGTGRAKRIILNGAIAPGGLLWPGQWVYVFRYGSTWVTNPMDQRWKPGVPVTFFVDPVLGNDLGNSDGLATGTGATKTIQSAVIAAIVRVDYGGILVSNAGTVQLAPGTYNDAVLINLPVVGGPPITIKGADDGVDPTPWNINVLANSVGIHVDATSSAIVKGLSFTGVGINAKGMQSTKGSSVTANNIKFNAFNSDSNSYHMEALDNSVFTIRDMTIVGPVYASLVCRRQSTIRMSGALTVSAGVAFVVFCSPQYGSSIVGGPTAQWGDNTDFHIVGGAGCTGIKYYIIYNSIIDLGAGLADALPGDVAGICGSGVVHGTDASMVVE